MMWLKGLITYLLVLHAFIYAVRRFWQILTQRNMRATLIDFVMYLKHLLYEWIQKIDVSINE